MYVYIYIYAYTNKCVFKKKEWKRRKKKLVGKWKSMKGIWEILQVVADQFVWPTIVRNIRVSFAIRKLLWRISEPCYILYDPCIKIHFLFSMLSICDLVNLFVNFFCNFVDFSNLVRSSIFHTIQLNRDKF